ncbi:MAG: hypothetical protein ACHQ1H_01265 [Nitrososphaerales archaeon]
MKIPLLIKKKNPTTMTIIIVIVMRLIIKNFFNANINAIPDPPKEFD